MKPYAEMTREELKALHDELSVQYREMFSIERCRRGI